MLLRSVGGRTLRDSWRGLLGWAAGLTGLVWLTAAAYPSVRDNPSLDELLESYPEALKGFVSFGGELDFGSAAGYLGVELFSFMVPLLLLIAAVSAGSAGIAGEEERGTLELLLSTPVSRARVVLEKLAALLAELVLLGLVLVAALVLAARAFDLAIGADKLAAATAAAVLLAAAFGALALFVGAATGRRGPTVAAVATLAVAAYFVNSLAPLLSALEPVRRASPFYWYAGGDPLRQGLDALDALLLLALGAAASAAAVLAFRRRDVAV